MAWTTSAMIRDLPADIFDGTVTGFDMDAASAVKLPMFNNSVTPDKDEANSAYNTGVWASANEVSDGAEWAAGGPVADSNDITQPSTGVIMFDIADEVSGASFTGTPHGVAPYLDNSTPADRVMSFNWFGGAVAVVDGQLTLAIHANGLWRITV